MWIHKSNALNWTCFIISVKFWSKALATLDIVKEIRMMNKVFNFKSYFVLQLNLFLGVMTEHFQIRTKVVNFKKQSGTGLHTEYPLSGKHMFEVLASMDYWSGAIWFNTLHSVFSYAGGLKCAIWVCTLHIIEKVILPGVTHIKYSSFRS